RGERTGAVRQLNLHAQPCAVSRGEVAVRGLARARDGQDLCVVERLRREVVIGKNDRRIRRDGLPLPAEHRVVTVAWGNVAEDKTAQRVGEAGLDDRTLGVDQRNIPFRWGGDDKELTDASADVEVELVWRARRLASSDEARHPKQ